MLKHDRIDQVPTGTSRGGVNKFFGPTAVPPETACDQDKQTQAEQKPAFPFEARFTEHSFKRTV
jgi:hypothetical protein